jgi:hypothetical protein
MNNKTFFLYSTLVAVVIAGGVLYKAKQSIDARRAVERTIEHTFHCDYPSGIWSYGPYEGPPMSGGKGSGWLAWDDNGNRIVIPAAYCKPSVRKKSSNNYVHSREIDDTAASILGTDNILDKE